jgi:hypothetical protein
VAKQIQDPYSDSHSNSKPIQTTALQNQEVSHQTQIMLKLTFKFKTTALQSQEAKLRSVPALTVRPDNGHKALTHFLVEETVSQGSCCSAPCSGEAHLLLCPTRQICFVILFSFGLKETRIGRATIILPPFVSMGRSNSSPSSSLSNENIGEGLSYFDIH